MILYFENSRGQWRPICQCANKIDVGIAIQRFLDEHHFKSYYTRTWDSDGFRHYDVGSHTEFFHWEISSDAKFPEGVFEDQFDALWEEATEMAIQRANEEGDIDIDRDYDIFERWQEKNFIYLCEREGLDHNKSKYV